LEHALEDSRASRAGEAAKANHGGVDATGLAQGAVSTRMYHHTQQRCLGGVG